MKTTYVKSLTISKNDKGYKTSRIVLPIEWLKDMDLTSEQSMIALDYDEKTKIISIKKHEKLEK